MWVEQYRHPSRPVKLDLGVGELPTIKAHSKRRATPRADVTKLGKYGMRLRPAHKVKRQIGQQGDLASNQDDERQPTVSPYLYQAGGKPKEIFMDRVSLRSNDNYCLN